MKRLVVVALALAAGAACAEDGAQAEVPTALVTDGGSRLIGLLAGDKPLVLRSEKGMQKLDLAKVRSILFGERFDPNLENEAQFAVGDLQSDQFATREKAVAKLRSLGRAAYQALKSAAASTDPEVAARAGALLGEKGLLGSTTPGNDAMTPGDTVVLDDDKKVQGLILPAELVLRSRWGRFKFPLASVTSLERLLPEELNTGKLAQPAAAPVAVKFKSAGDRQQASGCVFLGSGERLAGQLCGASLAEGLALRPEFLDEKAAPLLTALGEIERFEPAAKPVQAAPEGQTPIARKVLSAPAGVLLQSGDCFRARLDKLDAASALFLLPGGAELKLPRTLLRKIEFGAPVADPGEAPPPIAVSEDEKPGVTFRHKERPQAPPKVESKDSAEDKTRKKKKDVLQTIQELEPMPNVEILAVDTLTGELTIKDANGEMTIGMAPVKTLVFPKGPHVQAGGPGRREWVLTLREGSRFEVALTALSVEMLTCELSGYTATLPWQVIASLARRESTKN